MLTRPLGKTGVNLSILGFGCMRLPWDGPNHSYIDVPKAEALLYRAIDAGVNYFDTAWPYHGQKGVFDPGESEPFLGRALTPEMRKKVYIATKLPIWAVKDQSEMDAILDAQLSRLRTDCIDFYLVHGLVAYFWRAESKLRYFDFLARAKKDGRIRHVGFSFHDEFSIFAELLDAFDWEFVQLQYNYVDKEFQAGEAGMKRAAEKNVGVIIMEPLRGGSLVRDLPPKAEQLFKHAHPDWNMAEWGLRWLWNQPEITTVLSGMSNMEQVEDNIRIAENGCPGNLRDDDLRTVEKVGEVFNSGMKIGCTGCGYCMPCPHGVDIPRNFSFFNTYHLFDNIGTRRQTQHFYSTQMPRDKIAAHCVGCGLCVDKCPQHLPVATLMPQVADLFASNR
ncbi:MAG: aldo/keto reductase [Deltaproteobacteria bacterium]|nr:aldo/keto reductase [Deltaproteobacteria bacterium]